MVGYYSEFLPESMWLKVKDVYSLFRKSAANGNTQLHETCNYIIADN